VGALGDAHVVRRLRRRQLLLEVAQSPAIRHARGLIQNGLPDLAGYAPSDEVEDVDRFTRPPQQLAQIAHAPGVGDRDLDSAETKRPAVAPTAKDLFFDQFDAMRV
jgi:hypothetical protein